MAGSRGPGETGKTEPGASMRPATDRDDLARRSRELEAALAAKRPARTEAEGASRTSGMAGFGQALRLSSEFIAGVAVGAGIGWLIDRMAGTSPWGLIVFLLLGFLAGVLNVLRSAGLVAQPGPKANKDDGASRD